MAVIVEDTSQDPDWLPNPLLPETKTEAAVPITVGGRVLGVLDVQQNRVNGLNATDIALIQSIANQVAVALQNARAYVQVQQQADRESLITTLNQKIQRTTSVDEALQVAVSELGLALSAKSARIELRSNESPTFKN
jgi:GAF domain-containing protein